MVGRSHHETARFLDGQLAEWDECGFGCWIAFLEATQDPIGYVGLSVPMFLPEILPAVEVGWRFDPAFWGQGLASEGKSGRRSAKGSPRWGCRRSVRFRSPRTLAHPACVSGSA